MDLNDYEIAKKMSFIEICKSLLIGINQIQKILVFWKLQILVDLEPSTLLKLHNFGDFEVIFTKSDFLGKTKNNIEMSLVSTFLLFAKLTKNLPIRIKIYYSKFARIWVNSYRGWNRFANFWLGDHAFLNFVYLWDRLIIVSEL